MPHGHPTLTLTLHKRPAFLLTVTPALLPACVRYHLKDVILGKIYFLLVRIKIKHMELAIIRRESAGSG